MINKNILIPLSLLIIVLTGCSVHQRTSPDAGDLPAAFVEKHGLIPSSQIIDRWWESFDSPMLNDLIEETLANNLNLEMAFARLEQLKAAYQSTGAAQQPYLNLGGQASRDKQFSALGSSIGNTYRLSLSAGYELDLWQKLKSLNEAALLDTLAARENIKTIYISLTTQVADLYFLALEQRAQIKLIGAVIDSYVDTVERNKLRYELGRADVLAVYQAQESLAVARGRKPVYEAALARTEHALAILLGRFPEEVPGVVEAGLPEPLAMADTGLPSELLERRPDIREAHLRVQAQDERLAAAIANRFPSFNLMAGYGKSSLDFSSAATGTFWNFLAGVTQPAVDGGRLQAEEQRNRALLRETVANYRQTVLRAFQEVEDGISNNRTTEERLKLLTAREKVSRANVRVATDGYYNGINDFLPVLIAQRQFFDVQIQIISVRRQLLSDRLGLIKAMGGDWMVRHLEQKEEGESL